MTGTADKFTQSAQMQAAKAGHDERLQLRPLTRKITGKVKLNPSSATSGGGGGTGSDLRTIASAAWSNAASPDPLTMLAERTWPKRSSAKVTTISALFCERSAG